MNKKLASTLEEIVEVTTDVFVQMYAVCTHHIVSVAGIGEQIGMCSGIDTCT